MDGFMRQQANILAELQKDILLMQGFKPALSGAVDNGGLSIIKSAFPNKNFPIAAVHEFFCTNAEDRSASCGFISGILSSLTRKGGATVWVSASAMIFPPALQQFGIDPSKVIFIQPEKPKDILFVTEEALKCEGITAVVADIKEISFTESRRFQLAVEQSGVTGFILRNKPQNLSTACVTRWKIAPVATALYDDLPGLSFPGWDVELVKVRNGKPGKWQMEWNEGRFKLTRNPGGITIEHLRKVV
jgi:protein ImuA